MFIMPEQRTILLVLLVMMEAFFVLGTLSQPGGWLRVHDKTGHAKGLVRKRLLTAAPKKSEHTGEKVETGAQHISIVGESLTKTNSFGSQQVFEKGNSFMAGTPDLLGLFTKEKEMAFVILPVDQLPDASWVRNWLSQHFERQQKPN